MNLNLLRIVCVTLLFASSTANAAVINIADNRLVSSSIEVGVFTTDSYSNSETPVIDFAPFEQGTGGDISASEFFGVASADVFAYQNSLINSLSYIGYGTASVDLYTEDAGIAHGTSESVFSIQFSLDSPYQYNLTGNTVFFGSNLLSQASVSLTSNSGTLHDILGNETFDVSGILEAGTYTLTGIALVEEIDGLPSYPSMSGNALYDFTLDLAPVPVPPAVWLFGSGLIGLIGIARRKKV